MWKERVRKGIDASISDPVLFGNLSGVDDLVSWLGLVEINADLRLQDPLCRCE